MKLLGAILAIALAALTETAEQGDGAQPPRFVPVDIVLDSPEPVAAWQFELSDRSGAIKVVGVENGDSSAFADAPYYDRAATQAGEVERLVVADYSLADAVALPDRANENRHGARDGCRRTRLGTHPSDRGDRRRAQHRRVDQRRSSRQMIHGGTDGQKNPLPDRGCGYDEHDWRPRWLERVPVSRAWTSTRVDIGPRPTAIGSR